MLELLELENALELLDCDELTLDEKATLELELNELLELEKFTLELLNDELAELEKLDELLAVMLPFTL